MTNKRKIKVLAFTALILLVFGAMPTTAAPQLSVSNGGVVVSNKQATIRFDTNLEAHARVDFGETSDYGLYIQAGYQPRINHTILIPNLKPETTYHYSITVESVESRLSTFDATFKTLKGGAGQGPTISNPAIAAVTGTTATIQWLTDEEATSVVRYGFSSVYSASAGSRGRTTKHDVTIGGLSPNGLYHFQIESVDGDGNLARYHDLTFRTAPNSDGERALLKMENIRPNAPGDLQIGSRSVTISWKTNKLSSGAIRYGEGAGTGSGVDIPGVRTFEHRHTIQDLKPNTLYSFKVSSRDIFGKTAESETYTFRTLTSGGEAGSAGQVARGLLLYANFDQSADAVYAAGSRDTDETGEVVLHSSGGVRGGAVFLGENGRLSFGGDPNFTIEQGTVAFWVRPLWNGSDDRSHDLFDLNPFYRGSGDKGFSITKHDAAMGEYNPLMVSIEDAADADYRAIGDGTLLRAGTWSHVAITWEFGGSAVLYINGTSVDSTTLTGSAPNLGGSVHFGKSRNNADAFFDDIAVYDTVLSSSEIVKLRDTGPETLIAANDDLVRVLGYTTLFYTPASAVVKSESGPDVYAVLNGMRYRITSPTAFERYGYRWGDVRTISDTALAAIPEVRLVKSPDSDKVYYLYSRPKNKKIKLHLPSPSVFASYPSNRWSDIVTVDQADLDAIPSARLVKTAGESTVYLLEFSQRRPIASMEAFERRGYDLSDIVEVSAAHLAIFPVGETVR